MFCFATFFGAFRTYFAILSNFPSTFSSLNYHQFSGSVRPLQDNENRLITCTLLGYVWAISTPRKAAEFDSSLCFMLGWLPLLYVFPPCSAKERRGEERNRLKNAGERVLASTAVCFFSRAILRPKNSMKNYHIIFEPGRLASLFSRAFLLTFIILSSPYEPRCEFEPVKMPCAYSKKSGNDSKKPETSPPMIVLLQGGISEM